jgi:plasmid stabilization system protein ParE
MTATPIEFHEAAAAEYEAAFAWYLERSEIAATRFAQEVSRSLDLISAAPHRGGHTPTRLVD